ncbi:hypothetical protein QO004_006085 [Rhizobium mesoamericanum]|nr:hypothetical protein [Rhizobium mesoamericanum]
MTLAFPRRASIRSGSRGSIAANSASRTTARSRSACQSPTSGRACPLPTGFICPRSGPTMPSGGVRRKSLTSSHSRPSRPLRSTRSEPRRPPELRPACVGRRRLWRGRRVPHRPVGAQPRLCRGRAADTQCLATRRGTIATRALAWKGAANLADAPQPRAQPGVSQGFGAGTAARWLADHWLAGRHQY